MVGRENAENTWDAGCLVLVVGPSGAGKDSLLQIARDRLSDDPRFVFPMRFITRPTGQCRERHLSISTEDFHEMAESGAFFLSWTAHGHGYGLPADIHKHLEAGCTVVANVSRKMIGAAQAKAGRVEVISIVAPKDVLAERLRARAREGDEAIASRLSRTAAPLPADVAALTIENVGPRERAADRMIALLRGTQVPFAANPALAASALTRR